MVMKIIQNYQDGKIQEKGSHDELIAREGLYKETYLAQKEGQ